VQSLRFQQRFEKQFENVNSSKLKRRFCGEFRLLQ
jgi:hypothetical protein